MFYKHKNILDARLVPINWKSSLNIIWWTFSISSNLPAAQDVEHWIQLLLYCRKKALFTLIWRCDQCCLLPELLYFGVDVVFGKQNIFLKSQLSPCPNSPISQCPGMIGIERLLAPFYWSNLDLLYQVPFRISPVSIVCVTEVQGKLKKLSVSWWEIKASPLMIDLRKQNLSITSVTQESLEAVVCCHFA